MYSDGFVSSSFILAALCGFAMVVCPVTGFITTALLFGFLGPGIRAMDRQDHAEYCDHHGIW
jgi:hypothetical protein